MPTATEIAQAAAIMRQATRDESYKLLPLGDEVASYLRVKRKRLSEGSYSDYEATLARLTRHFADLRIEDFEPPIGTERIEEFMDSEYGDSAPRTYNKNLSIIRDFFKHQVIRGKLHGDPTLAIERARTRQVYRTTFSPDQRRAIVGAATSRRDQIALRLLLDYGLRKGALRDIRMEHFNANRRRLVIFTKGGKVRDLPLPDPKLWDDIEILRFEIGDRAYLMHQVRWIPNKGYKVFADRNLKDSGLHKWWYARLADAGITERGVLHGQRMHKARHTAGQRMLDATGNLKAAQKLLGHESITTTADVYTDWDSDQLAHSLASYLGDESDTSSDD